MNPNDIKVGDVAMFGDIEITVLNQSATQELSTIMKGRHAEKQLTKDLSRVEDYIVKTK